MNNRTGLSHYLVPASGGITVEARRFQDALIFSFWGFPKHWINSGFFISLARFFAHICFTFNHFAMSSIIVAVIAALAGLGLGLALATTLLRKAIEKKSVHLLEEAETKAEVIRKEKILQAKEKFLQLK